METPKKDRNEKPFLSGELAENGMLFYIQFLIKVVVFLNIIYPTPGGISRMGGSDSRHRRGK
jgi:hypothetical protein